jgi:holliday junction DNA helicase RuvA
MYSYIIGDIVERRENLIVVENNKIGYEIFVSNFANQFFSNMVGEIKVYTYYQQREDGVSLFGFYCLEEKEMFLKLITASGVGPKGAMTILSNISVSDLNIVISSGDTKTLSKVKGVGKKTAERIVVDLKDKLGNAYGEISLELETNTNGDIDDAVTVLVSLGVAKMEAVRLAKSSYAKGDKAEDIIRKCLTQIG